MKYLTLVLGLVAALVFGAALAMGCSSTSSLFQPNPFDDGGGDGDDDGATVCTLGCGSDAGAGAIDINPKNVLLTVTSPGTAAQNFTATMDGQDVTATVVFTYDSPLIGGTTAATFNATGNAGGIGNLTATLGAATGSTTVAVQLSKTVIVGVSGGQKAALDSPTGGADPAMQLVYPYKDTFFPLGVLAPEMQWNGAGASDVYKLVMTEKYYTYTEYFATGTPSRHLMGQADWSNYEISGNGPKSDPVAVSLTRMSGSTAYNPVTSAWHIVQGKLHGSVYYWELPGSSSSGNGRILRIKPDSTTVDPFFPNGGQCWGCHTVSRDGNTVLASFNFPVAGVNVSKPTAVKASCDMGQGTFSAFDNTGKYALVSQDHLGTPQYGINLFDVSKCTLVTSDVFKGFGAGAEPAWSPNGLTVAAITNGSASGEWFFDSAQGDLTIGTAAGTKFSAFKTIITQAKLPQGRPAYPSFDPTSAHIAFGNPTAGSRSTGSGDLWITDLTGSFKQLKIGGSDGKSFNPVYAPLRAGGYSWIVFITRRDYGNESVGADNQQLWVTAIDDPPTTADPSHAAFYLRGQEMANKSENAYYALDPCKAPGAGCESGVDCCTGQCVLVAGKYVCGMTNDCSQDGNRCTTNADCCHTTSSCTDGYCTPPPPN